MKKSERVFAYKISLIAGLISGVFVSILSMLIDNFSELSGNEFIIYLLAVIIFLIFLKKYLIDDSIKQISEMKI